ncbi:sensor histidine kinase [Pseudonocardia lacus]|uniref:sensor histidine kinase n=1 Tax=Pseudonocardia lacus TaxID=2835865 RepID=UPI0027E2740B|nr:sensor histidine kinase [Pseudonocardia lacus]
MGVTPGADADRPLSAACAAAPPRTGHVRGTELDARQVRIDTLLNRYVGYLGLAIGVVLTPFLYESNPAYLAGVIGTSLASAVWTYCFVTRRPAPAEEPRWGVVYVVGLLGFMGALVLQSGFFGFQSFAGYVHSFAYLRGRGRWVGLTCTASLAAYGQIGSPPPATLTLGLASGWLVLSLLNAVVAGMFMYFSEFGAAQTQRHRNAIEELNEANRQLSETLAENAALQVRLLASAREAGVLDERARLAREIHDTIAQGLAGVITQLEAAGSAEDDPTLRRRHVDTAMGLARESLREARRSVEALTPGQLDRAQLPDAIAEMAKRWAETADVALVLDTTGVPVPLLPEIEVALFRVAQEALVNVGKHADAERVGLTLSYMDDVVVLDVRDDGRGFVRDGVVATADSGFGLAAMETRVRRVSGTLTVESAPGEGTALSASVPAIPAEVRS